jgi:membrane-associated protease RseP (regulator of RpoE activity)
LTNDALAPTRPFPPAEPLHTIWRPPEPRQRFQHVLWKHVLLFLLTLATTTLTGATYYQAFLTEFTARVVPFGWSTITGGLWFSLTVLAILGAHEMGHYLACRWYRVDASLPYFLPFPLSLAGTLGAVIRIKEPFPNRAVLFDVGVAGPLAGFVVLVPALFVGFRLSTIVPAPPPDTVLDQFAEPLLMQAVSWLVLPPVQPGFLLNAHPIVFAAWFGMLVTAINLIPFAQLDGGHLSYALLRRRATPLSIASVIAVLVLTLWSLSWLVMAAIMLVVLRLVGAAHPPSLDDDHPIGTARYVIAALAVLILILCFVPVPLVLG